MREKFRVIYEIMAIGSDGKLAARYFAANKTTAEKIRKTRLSRDYEVSIYEVSISRLRKEDHYWVNPADVERL